MKFYFDKPYKVKLNSFIYNKEFLIILNIFKKF